MRQFITFQTIDKKVREKINRVVRAGTDLGLRALNQGSMAIVEIFGLPLNCRIEVWGVLKKTKFFL